MINQLDGERPTALVTGGSRGIGKAIALGLANSGFQIILTYVSRPDEAEKTVEEIRKTGGKALAFALDVGDPAAVEALFAAEIKDKINLSALINNAGITKDGLLLRMKDEAFERVIDVNLTGAFVCSREAAKIMTKRRFGRIVNISSVVGQMGNAGQTNYSASKAGLIGLTKACSRELASRNITVNAVAPGFIETEMTAGLDEATRRSYIESIPLKRLGLAEDVANAVVFLASDKASYITGQVIAVNGGMYA
ncbi:MAG: 3-oxoacyl-[acyl-carrier-protein] reductase [Desulfovibrio sp.]|nr:3-oxoacyl-[acyl-carrier-protein] reductase [Desulfovibrio sp.]